jgi:hypothetical protein
MVFEAEAFGLVVIGEELCKGPLGDHSLRAPKHSPRFAGLQGNGFCCAENFSSFGLNWIAFGPHSAQMAPKFDLQG